jgi:hypothetical protein
VQINGYNAGLLAAGAVQVQEFPSTLELQAGGPLLQLFREEAAVEVTIDVTAAAAQRFRVADHPLHHQTCSVNQIRVGLPLLQQPRGIDLIPVGAGHHKNATAAHEPQRTKF